METMDRRAFLKTLVRSILIGGSVLGCGLLFVKNAGKPETVRRELSSCTECTLFANCDLPRARDARAGGIIRKDGTV